MSLRTPEALFPSRRLSPPLYAFTRDEPAGTPTSYSLYFRTVSERNSPHCLLVAKMLFALVFGHFCKRRGQKHGEVPDMCATMPRVFPMNKNLSLHPPSYLFLPPPVFFLFSPLILPSSFLLFDRPISSVLSPGEPILSLFLGVFIISLPAPL